MTPINFYCKNNILEKNILLRFLRSTMIIVCLYSIYDFLNQDDSALLKSALALLLFGSSYGFVKYTNGSRLSIRVTVTLFMLATVSGFFFQGGFKGIASLDFCALIVALIMILVGRERRTFLFFYLLQMIVLGSIQLFHSEWILNYRANDPPIVDIVEVLARIGNMLYIGHLYKTEYEKERAQLVLAGERLKDANTEISAQSEIIANYNAQLETMVKERAKYILQLDKKIIEYSFVNSHKVRGPLARVLGLVNLMKMNSESGTDYCEYLGRLEVSANELDDMIRELTLVLSEETKEGNTYLYCPV